MRLEFLKAALLDDELLVTVQVKERRAASMLFGQVIQRRDGTRLIEAEVRVACVDVERMVPVRIPDDAIPGLTP
jgi:acyl-CoA thioester hydrolase